MIKRIFFCGLLTLCLYSEMLAQQNITLYQMHGILQSNSLNPSVASDCKWNVGFPLFGNVSFAAGLPISYNDLGAGSDVINTPKILSSLKDNNIVSANGNITLFTLGYRMEKSYFQFNINERFSAAASFPKNLLGFLTYGNSQFAGQTFNGTFNFSGMYYREYAFTGAFEVIDNTWVGVRGRLLFGRISALGNNNISLYTDADTYALTFNSDFDTRLSMPGDIKFNQNSGTVAKFNPQLEAKNFMINPSNLGGALDFGFNTSLENGWQISASILNLGMINWSNDNHQFTLKKIKKYSGSTADINSWVELRDTLQSIFKPYYSGSSSYSQWLFPTMIAGANYPVSDYLRLGFTGYGEFNSAGVPWALSVNLLTQDIEHIHGALSYTVTNNSFFNLGFGLGLEFGSFNIHAVTDNIISLFSPASQNYGTIQFGINFKFGCGEGSDSSKSYKSVPCPSYGGARNLKSVPCPR